ncbi:MAG: BLUF domain-containing protein [Hellea sp.]
MSLSQLIYTSTCTAELTPLLSHQASFKSVQICNQLGLTGRVFANDISAFAMTEGPTEIVQRYFKAVEADPLVETIILHVDRPIKQREFSDYFVLLNSKERYDFGPSIGVLTPETLNAALPSHPSIRLRIMVEAFKQDVLAA